MKHKKTSQKEEDQFRNRDDVMKRVFQWNFVPGAKEVPFTMDQVREAIAEVAKLHPGSGNGRQLTRPPRIHPR
jgi:hypothetical protein